MDKQNKTILAGGKLFATFDKQGHEGFPLLLLILFKPGNRVASTISIPVFLAPAEELLEHAEILLALASACVFPERKK